MKTAQVQQILREVQPTFVADIPPISRNHLLQFLHSKECLERAEFVELLETPGHIGTMTQLFLTLGGRPASVNLLIEYFTEQQTGQPHLLSLLTETKDRVLKGL